LVGRWESQRAGWGVARPVQVNSRANWGNQLVLTVSVSPFGCSSLCNCQIVLVIKGGKGTKGPL
jgi:hypothetical protein